MESLGSTVKVAQSRDNTVKHRIGLFEYNCRHDFRGQTSKVTAVLPKYEVSTVQDQTTFGAGHISAFCAVLNICLCIHFKDTFNQTIKCLENQLNDCLIVQDWGQSDHNMCIFQILLFLYTKNTGCCFQLVEPVKTKQSIKNQLQTLTLFFNKNELMVLAKGKNATNNNFLMIYNDSLKQTTFCMGPTVTIDHDTHRFMLVQF